MKKSIHALWKQIICDIFALYNCAFIDLTLTGLQTVLMECFHDWKKELFFEEYVDLTAAYLHGC